MAISNSSSQYGEVAKVFHWTTAILILILMPLGMMANNAPFETSEQLTNKAWLFSLHKTLGVAVFFVALLRILWALTQSKPAPLHPENKLETFAAEVAHWLLYGSLVLVPLSGWIHHAATTGFAPIWWPFGQNLPFVPKDEGVAHLFGNMHWIWTKLLLAALLAHIAGALKHVVVDRDATLRRMWFGTIGNLRVPAVAHKVAVPAAVAMVLFVASGVASGMGQDTKPEVAPTSLQAATSQWQVLEGNIEITITQFGNRVTGSFDEWTSSIEFDPETGLGSVETTIAIGSLTLGSVTDQAMGADFFNVDSFPTATYVADIAPTEIGYIASGTLTVRGVSVPVELPFGLELGAGDAQMSGSASVRRLDFGVGASMPDETNLGFDVDISINLVATLSQ